MAKHTYRQGEQSPAELDRVSAEIMRANEAWLISEETADRRKRDALRTYWQQKAAEATRRRAEAAWQKRLAELTAIYDDDGRCF